MCTYSQSVSYLWFNLTEIFHKDPMDQQKSISQPKRRETEGDKEEDEDVDVGQLAESVKYVRISSNKSDDGKPLASGTSQHQSG